MSFKVIEPNMDERDLEEKLAMVFIDGWDTIPTGNGYLLTSDWRWPNGDRIEIHVRMVGEREDLYLVTDGGDLFNFLYANSIDLSKDKAALDEISATVANYEARFIDYQIVKGANEEDLPRAIRSVLEAVKDASLILWHKLKKGSHLH